MLESDWESDCKRRAFLTKPIFIEALLELASIWARKLTSVGYVSWLRRLYEHIAQQRPMMETAGGVAVVANFARNNA